MPSPRLRPQRDHHFKKNKTRAIWSYGYASCGAGGESEEGVEGGGAFAVANQLCVH